MENKIQVIYEIWHLQMLLLHFRAEQMGFCVTTLPQRLNIIQAYNRFESVARLEAARREWIAIGGTFLRGCKVFYIPYILELEEITFSQCAGLIIVLFRTFSAASFSKKGFFFFAKPLLHLFLFFDFHH